MAERPIGMVNDASGVRLIWAEKPPRAGGGSDLPFHLTRIIREKFNFRAAAITTATTFLTLSAVEMGFALTSNNPVSMGTELVFFGASVGLGAIFGWAAN